MIGRVGLIVRCFNEEAHLGRLLAGAQRQTRPPDEVIVVDSGSTDASLSIAAAFGAHVVSIRPEAFSFGRALNVGVAASTSDLLVFASAHVYPIYDTWLAHLLAPFEADAVALTYGRQEIPPHGRYSEKRLLEQWFPAISVASQSHPFCNNANAAIRRSVWADLPYNEELTGLEDLDWAKRALERRREISYVAEAPVVHVHDESFGQVLNRYRREAIAHKQIYDEQRMGFAAACVLAAVNIVGDLRACRREDSLRLYWRDIPKFRIAQFAGTYQGFAQAGPVTDVLRRRFYYPTRQSVAALKMHREREIGHQIDYESLIGSRGDDLGTD